MDKKGSYGEKRKLWRKKEGDKDLKN